MILFPFIFYKYSSKNSSSKFYPYFSETYEEWVENEKWLLRHLLPSLSEKQINEIDWNKSSIKVEKHYENFNKFL